jgi:hypothetical protein
MPLLPAVLARTLRAEPGPETFTARLVYPTGHGPASTIAVSYRAGDEVIVLLPTYHPALGYLDDAAVTVELLDLKTRHRTARGRSRILPDTAVPLDARAALEQFPEGVVARYVVICGCRPERRSDLPRRRHAYVTAGRALPGHRHHRRAHHPLERA